MKARLLLNPGAGRGRGARRAAALAQLASRHGLSLETSRDPGHLQELAARAVADGVERLLVAGGDGTLHLALQPLVGTTTALAPVPLGSGNDLAIALASPRGDMAAAVAHGLEAPLGAIDLARVQTATTTRHYSCVASLGFDAAVNAVANRIRMISGPAIYVWAVLRTLAGFRPPRLTLRWPGGEWNEPAMFAVAANGPSYGGGMKIAPNASLVDGQIDIVIVRAVSKLTLLAVFPKVFSGAHIDHPSVTMVRAPWVELGSHPDGDVYTDGEWVGPVGTATRVEAVARALQVVTTTPELRG